MVNNIIEMKNITMIFNKKIIANENIDLEIKEGEIHALIGENGAGKSTLMSILFGIYNPTKGTIKIRNKEEVISNPIKANRLGIGMVHQHFKMVDIFPLWRNISLGSEKRLGKMFIDSKTIKEDISNIMKKYNLNVDLNINAEHATVGMKQRAEILKILYQENDILVFDEPTAVLTLQEIDGFLEVLLELQKNGKTIILISHKMNEIKKVANRATVLRRGKAIGTYDLKNTSIDILSEAMVGRKLVEIKNNFTNKNKTKLLELRNISVHKKGYKKIQALKNISFEVKRGEIVAIAGVEGNGQLELAEAISGMTRPFQGEIFINEEDITKKGISQRFIKYKMSHIPEDRHKHGLALDWNLINNSVFEDISTPNFSRKGILRKGKMQKHAQEIIEKFDVRNADFGFSIARQLSGGNQQKLIIGREMSRESDFYLIFQPTRGLDIGSIEFIHSEILKLKNENKGILLISYELSEIISLADRILVVNSGEIIGEIEGVNADRTVIGKMMMGVKN
ncbi:ABC transporter ATP-binding protein [Spiroplasma taiwanense]|uniref:Ribose/galactose ABC transporter ATP-binding protein n=1 Tax=Spiroplasma taiwanense CT-1 TaxID=1276220 RepID=S5LW11_9MOLU|nr:ABC transporter ATP-binding protein [Spiroplasma taiwanense]AGR40781.1 ribose/galactose ABC transporter ATP-binding protein [Spiroplasma taiwanense CT-1]